MFIRRRLYVVMPSNENASLLAFSKGFEVLKRQNVLKRALSIGTFSSLIEVVLLYPQIKLTHDFSSEKHCSQRC